MSITSISATHNLTASVNYVIYGNGETGKQNRLNHTTRAVAISCTVQGGFKAFMAYGRRNKRLHSKIRNSGYNIIQSFNDKKFDYRNRKDVQIVNGMGVQLAQRLFPHSNYLVVTHIDGKGKKIHNHIIVINYDMLSKTAIRNNRDIRIIRAVNDDLMRQNNLETVTYGRNFDKEVNNQFDIELLTKLKDTREHATSFKDYCRLLKLRGVEVVQKTKNSVKGLVYKMMDTHATKQKDGKAVPAPRTRRRKASRYGSEFTLKGLQVQFELNRKRIDEEKEERRKQIQKMVVDRTRRQQKRVELANNLENADSHSKKREKSDKKEVQNQVTIRRVHIEDAENALTDNTKSNDRQALEELSDLGEVSSSKTATRKRSPRPQRDKKIETKTTAKNQRKKHEKIQLPTADDILLEINNEQQKKHDDSKQF